MRLEENISAETVKKSNPKENHFPSPLLVPIFISLIAIGTYLLAFWRSGQYSVAATFRVALKTSEATPHRCPRSVLKLALVPLERG